MMMLLEKLHNTGLSEVNTYVILALDWESTVYISTFNHVTIHTPLKDSLQGYEY